MNYTVFCAMCTAQIKVYETQLEALNVAKQVITSKFNNKVLNNRLPNAINEEIKRLHPAENLIVRLNWGNYMQEGELYPAALTVYDGKNRAYRTSDPDRNGYCTTGYVTEDTVTVVIPTEPANRIPATAVLLSIKNAQLRLLEKIDGIRHDIRQYDEVRQAAAKLHAAIDNFRKQYSYRLRACVPGCNL